MAQLQGTTITGDFTINSGGKLVDSGSSWAPWYKMSHCDCHSGLDGKSDCLGTGYPWLHIRTPIPGDNTYSGIEWTPYMLEVVGYHTYSGERFHDHKWVINTTDQNAFNANLISEAGATAISDYNVYRSASTYGGKKRVVVVVPKISCCCTGYLWIRYSTVTQYRADYPYATSMFNSTTVGY
jgi:hypothetical protein